MHPNDNDPREPDNDDERHRAWLDQYVAAERHQSERTDAKASIVLVIPTAGTAIAFTVLADLPKTATHVAQTALGIALASVALLVAVIWPRRPSDRNPTAEDLLAQAQYASADPEADLKARAEEGARLRAINNLKWKLLRFALIALAGAVFLAAVAVDLG
ncbi:hypothetical protein [Glycomyces sp. NPDC048151]|uniref:hypothetical protein n=1 Tax=Glycomyces sp. NPDC048151 TaxID=3364002 RepID=UPI003719DD7C